MAWYVDLVNKRRYFQNKDKCDALECYQEDGVEFGYYNMKELFNPFTPLMQKLKYKDLIISERK